MAGPNDVNPADDALIDGDNFTPEERAHWNAMQSGGDAPESDDSAGGAADGGDDGAAGGDAPTGDDQTGAGGAGAGAAGADQGARGTVAGDPAAAANADQGEDDDDDADGEAAAGAAGQPEADGRRRGKPRVGLKKFLGEKERADKLEADLKTERERFARVDERMRVLSEALQQPQNKQEQQKDDDPEPKMEDDVFAWGAWMRRDRDRLLDRINTMQQGGQQRDDDHSLQERYQTDVATFVRGEGGKHWQSAYDHVIGSRFAELAMHFYGIDVTDDAAPRMSAQQIEHLRGEIQGEERNVARGAFKSNQSPAQRIMAMARARGWRPPADDASAGAAAANGAGGAAANGANGKNGGKPGVKPNVSAEIERIKNGSEASTSLSDGGSAPRTPLTPQRLADMPQAEFEALMDRMSPEEFQALVEGRP